MNNRTGELIEKYRKEKGLTQDQLAKALGVSNSAISKWEHGTNLPDITLIEPLSQILGIDKLLLFTSENIAKEVTSERCKTIKKNNIIKMSICIILFFLTIVFTNFISYKVYTRKIKEIESSQTQVYSFYSTDEEYLVNGYIILNNEESVVIFDKLKYQDNHTVKLKSSAKLEEIKSVELYLEMDGEVVLTRIIKDIPKSNNVNEILTKFQTNNNKNVDLTNANFDNPSLKIAINYKKKIITKDIKIELHPKI